MTTLTFDDYVILATALQTNIKMFTEVRDKEPQQEMKDYWNGLIVEFNVSLTKINRLLDAARKVRLGATAKSMTST